MYKTVDNGSYSFNVPVNTPDHITAAIPDLSCSCHDKIRVSDPASGTYKEVYRPSIKEAPPKVDAKTYQYVKDLMTASFSPVEVDMIDPIVQERVETAVDLVLLDVIHDHVDQVLEATVQRATLSVLATYLQDDDESQS